MYTKDITLGLRLNLRQNQFNAGKWVNLIHCLKKSKEGKHL